MRLLKILFILPFLAYGVGMGYLWYETNRIADDVVQAATPFADISYDSIHTSLIGDEVGFDDVVIRPKMTQDEFRIEKIRLTAPHIGYFVSAGNSMEKGSLPDNIGVQISRMHIDTNSEIFSMLGQMQQQSAPAAPPNKFDMLSNLDALGCGDVKTFTLADYRRMGIGTIDMDLSVNLGRDEKRDSAHMTVMANVDKLYNIELFTDLGDQPRNVSSTMALNGIPKMTVKYRDTGYYKLRNAYCTKLSNNSVDTYIDNHVSLLGTQLGAALPENIITAYKDFLLKGGSFDLRIDPPKRLPVNGLEYYSLADIIDMLGLTMSINGKRLEKNLIQWGNKPREAKAEQAQTPEVGSNRKQPRPRTEFSSDKIKNNPTRPTYKAIDVGDAGKHLNRMIEVTTLDGRVRSGILENINDSRIYLAIKLKAGTLNYPVEIERIRNIRVLN